MTKHNLPWTCAETSTNVITIRDCNGTAIATVFNAFGDLTSTDAENAALIVEAVNRYAESTGTSEGRRAGLA